MDDPPTIDDLLQHYLALLDRYTTLRAELSRLQTATFQHLARAHFAAERARRFGSDAYDARMQALRRVRIAHHHHDGEAAAPAFHVVKTAVRPRAATLRGEQQQQEAETTGLQADEKEEAVEQDGGKDEEVEEETETPPQHDPRDPLRWFGLLTPPALRHTQACAVEAVERVVPQLLTVDAEMRRVEVEVRRARKRRAKAEAAAAAAAAARQQGAPREEVAASW